MRLKRKPAYYRKHFFKYVKRLLRWLAPSRSPAFLVIGVQKAATTSLYNYLDQLSEFSGSLNKEVNYFNQEIFYGRTKNWYHGFFRSYSSRAICFEATPEYFYFPWVPEMLYRYNPDLKLIVVLRDPVERAFSAWKMYAAFFRRGETFRFDRGLRPGEENYVFKYFYQDRSAFPSFEECVKIELALMREHPEVPEPSLLRRGLYHEQLQRYLRFFPREQVLIVAFRSLTEQPGTELARIRAFLTGRETQAVNAVLKKRNTLPNNAEIPAELRQLLDRFFEQPNKSLHDFLGYHLHW